MSKASKRGTKWEAQRKRVLDRDSHQCQYCGKHLEGADATVDHIEAVALDPERVYGDDELVAACRTCNGRKQDKVLLRTDWYETETWFPSGKVPL